MSRGVVAIERKVAIRAVCQHLVSAMRGPRSKIDHDGQRLPSGVFWRGDVYEFIYRDATGRQRQETVNNVESAVKLRAERMRAARRDRVMLAPWKRRARASAYRASMAAADLNHEKALAKAEVELAAVRLERKRVAKMIKALPADQKAAGRALTFVLGAAQALDRAIPAAEGMEAVRLRAAQMPLYEVEDSLKRALFTELYEHRGKMRT